MPLITTTKGPMEAGRIPFCRFCGNPVTNSHALTEGVPTELELTEQVADNEKDFAHAVEYRLNGELVHRSAHTHIKHGITTVSDHGRFA